MGSQSSKTLCAQLDDLPYLYDAAGPAASMLPCRVAAETLRWLQAQEPSSATGFLVGLGSDVLGAMLKSNQEDWGPDAEVRPTFEGMLYRLPAAQVRMSGGILPLPVNDSRVLRGINIHTVLFEKTSLLCWGSKGGKVSRGGA
jgi:hypothetical protein